MSSTGGILMFLLFCLSVIESTAQARGSDTEIRTSGALVDGVELVTMLARNGEQALLPAGLGGVLAASEVTGHIGPLTGSRDATRPGAGPSASPSAGITTRPPTHTHPPGEFQQGEGPCLLYPAHGLSVTCGLGIIPALLLEAQNFGRDPIPEEQILFLTIE